MRERSVKVKVGGPAGLVEDTAILLGCPNCPCEKFLIYTPRSVGHLHFQCVNCGVSFCDGCEDLRPLKEKSVGTLFSPRRQNPDGSVREG